MKQAQTPASHQRTDGTNDTDTRALSHTPKKTKVEKAQSYLTVVSTSIGILGAVGTAFVWLVSTFFIGTVEIKPDRPIETLQVKVISSQGQQGTYFNKVIQLMPGNYHVQIGEPDKPANKHVDVTIQLWKSALIPYAVPASTSTTSTNTENVQQTTEPTETTDPAEPSTNGRKRWWQFWRKGGDDSTKENIAPTKGEAQ